MGRLTFKLNEKEEEKMSTKYLHFKYYRIPDYDLNRGNPGRITSDMLYNKLGELEELEEELGIDLIKVLKAIKQGYIYKKLGDGSIVKVDVDMLNFEEGFKGGIFSKTYSETYGEIRCLQCYKMDTYLNSETWSLTKDGIK